MEDSQILLLTSLLHVWSLGCYASGILVAIVLLLKDRSELLKWAVYPVSLGFAGQFMLLMVRWYGSGHLPVTGLFETQHFLALWVVAAALYFYRRYCAWTLLPSAVGLALGALAFASMGPRRLVPLTPAIDTPLFLLHVATSFSAYGLFGVGAIASLYQIFGFEATNTCKGRRIIDECLYIGYILFSGCMIAGSLWAYLSWGSYWTWKIKGLWSYLLWFYYSGVLHVRNRSGWQGRPVSLLAVLGFVLVVFTYLGLGLLFETSHPLL